MRASFLPSDVVMVAIGPLPPPEKLRAEPTAVGVTVPSALLRSVASTGRQEPSAPLARSGTGVELVVRVPSGLAEVCELAPVSASMTTARPVSFALARAAWTAPAWPASAGLAGGAGQEASAGPWPRSAATATVGATSRPAPSARTAAQATGRAVGPSRRPTEEFLDLGLGAGGCNLGMESPSEVMN